MTPKTTAVLTVNILKGMYKCKRLPFGVAVVPAILQPFMDMTLSRILGTCAYLDDIVVNGVTFNGTIREYNASRLEMVLNRQKTANLRRNLKKCKFGVSQVSFLVHRVDAAGILTTKDKTCATMEEPPPTSKQTL